MQKIVLYEGLYIEVLLMSGDGVCWFWYCWNRRILGGHAKWLLCFWDLLGLRLRVTSFLGWCSSLPWISPISDFFKTFLSLFFENCLLIRFWLFFGGRPVSVLVFITEGSISDNFLLGFLLLRCFLLFFTYFVLFSILNMILRFVLELLHRFIVIVNFWRHISLPLHLSR